MNKLFSVLFFLPCVIAEQQCGQTPIQPELGNKCFKIQYYLISSLSILINKLASVHLTKYLSTRLHFIYKSHFSERA